MIRPLALLVSLPFALAHAQETAPQQQEAVPAQDAAATDPALLPLAAPAQAPLQPFVADYQVYRDGKRVGDATLQVVRLEADRWRVDLGLRGTRGLVRLVGLNIEQSTLFDVADGQYRPLSQSTVRHALFSGKKNTGVYDWSTHSAIWQGDVKKDRRAAVPLQDGDMSALLINLAIVRDATPGKQLQYRFVDDGRVRNHEYLVSPELEKVTVDDLDYNAMRVNRVRSGSEETILWVSYGVPTPIRMVQRKDGQDVTDLRLIQYTRSQ
ncbi:DUF3108 domain-containing protein [Luteimonas sp. SX5]|uniref:DUF3108 domain-containing protein n=1 Tax=Luteimonas galliterrae TaxID=2940486 RepID=A0ABT0MM02_9GAMM|nr:DUF3108 domain-containing protein [Luteimonas galliterrae]MCL1635239.1 DUF3108 domain-containing protein [Luteimonas galliterrae]